MSTSATRRAFTLVEAIVVVLVGVNLLAVLWRVFLADQERFARDQGKLASLQSALTFAEVFENDLREMVLGVPDPANPGEVFTLDDPVIIPAGARSIMFLRTRPEPGAGRVPVFRVSYTFDERRAVIRRRLDAFSEDVRNLVVESCRFELVRLTPSFSALALEPSPVLFRPALDTLCVKYQLSTSPEPGEGRTPADVPPEQKVTLVNAVPLTLRSERANFPHWSYTAAELPGGEAP